MHYLRFREKLTRDIGLVYLKDDYQPQAVQELIEFSGPRVGRPAAS